MARKGLRLCRSCGEPLTIENKLEDHLGSNINVCLSCIAAAVKTIKKKKNTIMDWSLKLMSNISNLKLSIILVIISLGIALSGHVLFVYPGGPERDYDERYEDIPGVNECWYDGYADGQDHPFNHDRNEECKDKGNQYYRAFMEGCLSVEGNTKEVCESATDA